jgi:hypothetical protein
MKFTLERDKPLRRNKRNSRRRSERWLCLDSGKRIGFVSKGRRYSRKQKLKRKNDTSWRMKGYGWRKSSEP